MKNKFKRRLSIKMVIFWVNILGKPIFVARHESLSLVATKPRGPKGKALKWAILY